MKGFIKFYLAPYVNPAEANYQHALVALAEGCRELGLSFCGNIDYWFEPERNDYLIRKDIHQTAAEIHVYDASYFMLHPEGIDQVDFQKINVLTDLMDGFNTFCTDPRFSKFDLILKTHYSKNFKYPKNVRPWAFGLSQRILDQISRSLQVPIGKNILVNYRVPHDIRARAVAELVPVLETNYKIVNQVNAFSVPPDGQEDKHYWEQSGRRHYPEFYASLNSSSFTFCFGGSVHFRPLTLNFVSKILRQYPIIKYKIGLSNLSSCAIIYQYDSWRLWECLASNSVPLHMDFGMYDWVLPEMPVEGVHYIGVGDSFKRTGESILRLNSGQIRKIAGEGRAWVLEHYSPKPTASRLFKFLSEVCSAEKWQRVSYKPNKHAE